jgi:hypothetical protein
MQKEHILREIRRTAQANGGSPLGRQRFAKETGIREADWIGKHWARWGEAVHEAGYAPNQLQAAYDGSVLFDRYIDLIRESGKIPTASELRLKHHREPSFPTQKTFDRFGSKADFIIRLIEHCNRRKGYEDVLPLCEDYVTRNCEQQAGSESKIDDVVGYVYLIRSGRFHKIGRSNAAGRREYELAIQLPEKAAAVHVIRTDDPIGIEAYWHKRFEERRKNGEWFELRSADITAFKRWKRIF